MRKNSLVKGLAGAAALAGASQAYGTVIVRPTPANIAGNNPTNTSSATITRNIDVDGNGTNDIQVRYRSFTTGGYVIQQSFAFSNTGQTAAYGPVGSNSQFYAYQLALGDVVNNPGSHTFGQNATFLTHLATDVNGSHYGLTSQWYLGQSGFLGFSFLNASSVLCFGYLELQTNAWTGAGTIGVQFFQLRYEDSGGPITIVPEPSTLAALAFGGVGLAAAAYRRRKNA